MMDKLNFGDVVLLKFPFTDTGTFKRRPALIIKDLNDGDIVVCRITSHIYNTSFDVYVENWKITGLKLPSVIRVHKIATLEKNMVGKLMGSLEKSVKEKVRIALHELIE